MSMMITVFVIGYLMIAFEHSIKVDKAASALLTAVATWVLLVLGAEVILPGASGGSLQAVTHALRENLGEISEILFFLLGAMTIVELIDAHEGFRTITDRITTTHKAKLLWIVGLITFFLSAVLDNLTTTIVMISLLRRLVDDQHERWFFAGIVIVAANAGGAWSPIGDVTTTMLWIGNQISASGVVVGLILPSLAALLIPLTLLSFTMKGEVHRPAVVEPEESHRHPTTLFERRLVLSMGLGALLFVPVFKTVTGLPPYMGILFGLSILWIATEILHRNKNDEDKHPLSVVGVLRRIDTTSVLFFLGILLAVSSLATAGHLAHLATALKDNLGNVYAINIAIGLLSSVVDNVPLVAGAMKMYPLANEGMILANPDQAAWLSRFVTDGDFWELLAFCAGTGGSCLIIGSAAGVAAMGMERIDFFWYLRRIAPLALLGYFSGVGIYFLQHMMR